MNIGDTVKVEFEMKVIQIEQHLNNDEIILSGYTESKGERVYCRAPESKVKLIQPGVETVLREAYVK